MGEYRGFSPVIKDWLDRPGVGISSIRFEQTVASHPDFLKRELQTAFLVNRAIFESIPSHITFGLMHPGTDTDDTSAKGALIDRVTNLIALNRYINENEKYPRETELSDLTGRQLLELYDVFLGTLVRRLEDPAIPEDKLKTGKEIDKEEYIFELLALESGFTGYLLKYLDLDNLPRPSELNLRWGEGAPESPGEKTAATAALYKRFSFNDVNNFPPELQPVAGIMSVLVEKNGNYAKYSQINEEDLYRTIGESKRPSSPMDDLRHEINNLIKRNRAVDRAVGIETEYPSPADIDGLDRDQLCRLYPVLAESLLSRFNVDNFGQLPEKINWWGKELTPKEFLTTWLEHLSLHDGSLSFFSTYFNTPLLSSPD